LDEAEAAGIAEADALPKAGGALLRGIADACMLCEKAGANDCEAAALLARS